MLPNFFNSILELIVKTSTELPPDVRAAMKTALISAPAGTRSSQALTSIAQNIDLASHNEGAICQLPHLGRADRTLDGVRKCILHAVWNAQGKGCAPGAVGVCVGGDRTSGYTHAKEQLFRTLDDVNPDPRLAELEASIMGEVNNLGIGTMGFGGRVS